MAYLLGNICTKNYCNRTTIVEIIAGGWVVSFSETQCRLQCRDMFSCSLANKTARLIMLSSYNVGCRRTGSCLPGRCHEFSVSPFSL